MAVMSGNFGSASGPTGMDEVTNWKFSKKANLHAYCSASCNGTSKICAGTKSGSGSISGLCDTSLPTTEAGDDVTLALYYSATGFITVPATIENIDVEVNINDGSPVSFEASFQSDGEWS